MRITRDDVEQSGSRIVDPGRYLAEVTDAIAKTSRNGDAMLQVTFHDAARGTMLCRDYIMCSGPGLPMGYAKLVALQVIDPEKDEVEFESWDLIGRTVWLHLIHDSYSYTDKVTGQVKSGVSCKPNANRDDYGYERDPNQDKPEPSPPPADAPLPF